MGHREAIMRQAACVPSAAVFLVLCIAISAVPAHALPWSGIIPDDRAIDWSQAGISGGIPNRTTICATINATTYGNGVTDATATIQTAVDSCPANQIVYLPAGTYRLSGTVFVDHPVIIRGAGPSSTIVRPSDTAFLFSPTRGSYGGQIVVADWVAHYNGGATTLTLSSAAGLSVNKTITIDELSDPSFVNITGGEGEQGSYGRNNAGWEYGKDRASYQITMVQSINGNDITIDTPLYYTYNASLLPQVWWWDGNLDYAGAEDLGIDGENADYSLIIYNYCSNCWARNLELKNIPRSAIMFSIYSFRGEVRDCYIHDSKEPYGPTRYGIELGGSAFKIENNMFNWVVGPILSSIATSGSVIAYNFINSTATPNGAMFSAIEPHYSHTSHDLYEGNTANAISLDNIWGSGSHETVFRNRLDGGASPLYSNFRSALNIQANHRFVNVVGNVLGTPGVHTLYELARDTYAEDEDRHIYVIGMWSTAWQGMGNYDDLTYSTLMRWGNYDAVTGTVKWDAAEIPSGVAVPGSHTLPASFYLAARPGWWSTPWGTPAWPAIGPDVSGGDESVAGHAAKIPAQLCFEHTAAAGTAFDARSCYNETASPPAIPGNVNGDAVVNMQDLLLVAADFGKTSGFNQAADLAAPLGNIDLFDVMVVARNWGRTS
jgi:hypothetical protein